MSPPVRTAKRQRLDNAWVGVSNEITTTSTGMNQQSATLLPLLEAFAGVRLTDSEGLIEIVGTIRSRMHLLECADYLRRDTMPTLHDYQQRLSIYKLHGTLLLYLGFLLGSFKETPISVFRSLVFCLRDLYTNENVNITKCGIDDQSEELFVLIPKLLRLATENFHENIIYSQEQNVRDIVMGCFQIIKSWLRAPAILRRFLADNRTTTTLENFLLGILVLTDRVVFDDGTTDLEVREVFEGLKSRCAEQSEFGRLLDVAILAARSRPLSSCQRLPVPPGLEIFYWRCRSRVSSSLSSSSSPGGGCTEPGSSSRKEMIDCADRAVEAMLHYCTSDDRLLARQAMVCMAESIDDANDNTHIRLVNVITDSIMNDVVLRNVGAGGRIGHDGIEGNLVQRLECLGLCMKRQGVAEYFLQRDEWEKTFDVLVFMSVEEENINATEKAAAVVIPILKLLFTRVEEPPYPLFSKAIDISIELVSSQSNRIVEQMLDLLLGVAQGKRSKQRIKSNRLLPDLINALALLSSKNFLVEESTKAKLAWTFSFLVNEVKTTHFLARELSNLSFLVRLAAGSYCEVNDSRVQQISISVLVALARNPCNRRILAKEPGLLSSLIRYTRMTPEGSDLFAAKSISRTEIKERILLIADAL